MYKNKRIVTIIPARGGSKGVPRKNIKLLDGKPLIGYCIEVLKKSGVIDRVIVSTEDDEIATVSESLGAEIIWRPKELAADTALTEPVMEHALKEIEKKGYLPDYISLAQCTSPFLTETTIRQAVNAVVTNNFDSCITVFYPHTHEFKWRKSAENKDIFIPDHNVECRPRRQDLPKIYHENGAFYITTTALFKKTRNRFGGNLAKITAVEMNEEDSLQIDTEFDFWLVEQIITKKH
ncbi:MAG: acylneuraminate cytidylyltransferase family protein [Candidatus Niyogibacteria bacterium]|nr:acylneuraminate cytidylyltransferase family protein [Candidatus Niyogibacteria bacterium]